MDYKGWLMALLTGGVIGFIFAKFNLPAPAPLSVAGVLGIVGIAVGYVLGQR